MNPEARRPWLTVFVPAYNERSGLAQSVWRVLAALDRFGVAAEVLIVNDASRDDTAAVAAAMVELDPRIRCVSHPTNLGLVGNFNACLSKARGRWVHLMHHDDPVSLYLVTQPTDKTRLRPLVRVLVNMIVRLLADRMDFKNGRPVAHYRHRLLMMLDEFTSLGKLEIMQESLAFAAGYGIKCYLICQDINQLKSRETGYGHDESITSNCHVQNAYPPNRVETAEHLSRLTGQTTVVKEQITTSGRRTAAMLGQVSRTYQEVQRPLLTPDECLRMPGPKKNAQGEIEEAGDMVIYVAGYPAIYGKQPLYFKDPVFSARAAIPAPKVSDRLRAVAQAETEGEGITI